MNIVAYTLAAMTGEVMDRIRKRRRFVFMWMKTRLRELQLGGGGDRNLLGVWLGLMTHPLLRKEKKKGI